MVVDPPIPRATQEGQAEGRDTLLGGTALRARRKTFIRKDENEGADLALLDRLRAAITACLTDPADLGSLIVRPGVSFQGYEVFVRDRLVAVPVESLARNIEDITIEQVAQGIVGRLTDRIHFAVFEEPPSYRIYDLERERAHELDEVLRVVLGPEEADRFLEETLAAVDAALEGSQVNPERCLPVARIRMLRLETKRFLTEELIARRAKPKHAKKEHAENG